jgi:hypothetical protein
VAQVITLDFGGADPAAHLTNTALPLLGEPDIADVPSVSFPFPVVIVGFDLHANPSSGDTIAVSPALAGVAVTPAVTIAHVATAPSEGSWWGGPLDQLAVPANTQISMLYKTTTGGTYTANDILSRLYLKLPQDL